MQHFQCESRVCTYNYFAGACKATTGTFIVGDDVTCSPGRPGGPGGPAAHLQSVGP